MEVFLEQNITNEGIDKHRTRNTVLNVLRIVSIAWMVLGTIIFLNATAPGATFVMVLFDVLLTFIPPIFLFIITSKLLADLNAEYDYHIEGSQIRVVKILNRTRRRIALKNNFSAVSKIGLVDSDDFNTEKESAKRKILAFCKESVRLVYLCFNDDGEKTLLVLQADDELLIALRRSISPVVYAESFKKVKEQ